MKENTLHRGLYQFVTDIGGSGCWRMQSQSALPLCMTLKIAMSGTEGTEGASQSCCAIKLLAFEASYLRLHHHRPTFTIFFSLY